MFKDSLPSYQLPQPNDLSVPPKHEVEQIVSFIDNHIADFPHYYNQNKDSVRENWISNILVRHFNLCNCENGGYLPYEFSKNPPQASSTRETDIGVYINTRNSKVIPIMEFEANVSLRLQQPRIRLWRTRRNRTFQKRRTFKASQRVRNVCVCAKPNH